MQNPKIEIQKKNLARKQIQKNVLKLVLAIETIYFFDPNYQFSALYQWSQAIRSNPIT